ESGPPARTTGIGDLDLSRYHVVDMLAPVVEPHAFPPDYWDRLQTLVLDNYLSSMPMKQDFSLQLTVACEDAATMCEQSGLYNQRDFAMFVRPTAHSVGVGTIGSSKGTREVGCMVEETDDHVRRWIQMRIGHMTEMNQHIVQELAFLFRNNREEFIQLLSRVLAPSMMSQEVDCTPVQSSKECYISKAEFAANIGVGDESVSTEYVRRPTTSQATLALPLLENKSSLTDRVKCVDHGSLTEEMLKRSCGTQLRPVVATSAERGNNTDWPSMDAQTSTDVTVNSFNQQTESELLQNMVAQQAQEQANLLVRRERDQQRHNMSSIFVQTQEPVVSKHVSIATERHCSEKDQQTELKLLESLVEQVIQQRQPLRTSMNIQTARTATIDAAFSVSHASSHLHVFSNRKWSNQLFLSFHDYSNFLSNAVLGLFIPNFSI
ncbi:KN motif and ankyrin repeat domain, partial [Cichlidogyrus casuarinus]